MREIAALILAAMVVAAALARPATAAEQLPALPGFSIEGKAG